MLRLTQSLLLRHRFAKQVEPSRRRKQHEALKPRPPNMQALQEEQERNKLYLQFEALPTDPLHIIEERYIRKKKLLSQRKVYVPNKQQYMMQLDRNMDRIREIHENEIERENYGLPETVGERLQLQLEQEKARFYFNLIRDDQHVLALCAAAIMLLMVVEVFYCQPDYY